jgi:hypothetical protein
MTSAHGSVHAGRLVLATGGDAGERANHRGCDAHAKKRQRRVRVCVPQLQLNATEAMWATQASKRERIESLTTRTSQVKRHERQTCDGAVQVVLGETVWEQRHRVGHRRVKVGPQSSCYLRLCDEYAV